MKIIQLMALTSLLVSCQNENKKNESMKGSFGYDLEFLKKHKEVLVLKAPDNELAQLAIVGDYQGRVMTSTADGETGNSYGWMNYELIESKQSNPHINAFGGEERIWLSPEGGQFSVFFPKGASYDFEHWQTPAVIDTETYDLTQSDASSATFTKKTKLENNSGTLFDFEINRKISVLSKEAIYKYLGMDGLASVKLIGYETANQLKNTGSDWQKEKGVLGIWILGMFTPTEKTTIIVPYATQNSKEIALTTNYFGSIPKERLIIKDSTIFFKGDGKYRSKIGLAPASTKPVAGSYDAEKEILTIVQFDFDPKGDYMKATWEKHAEPYKGDVINTYNDGPVDGGNQLGPFYELESSSSVKALKNGESIIHHHRTFHIEGDKTVLDSIAKKVLGVSIKEIEKVF